MTEANGQPSQLRCLSECPSDTQASHYLVWMQYIFIVIQSVWYYKITSNSFGNIHTENCCHFILLATSIQESRNMWSPSPPRPNCDEDQWLICPLHCLNWLKQVICCCCYCRRYGLRDVFAEMLHLCRHCNALFWEVMCSLIGSTLSSNTDLYKGQYKGPLSIVIFWTIIQALTKS